VSKNNIINSLELGCQSIKIYFVNGGNYLKNQFILVLILLFFIVNVDISAESKGKEDDTSNNIRIMLGLGASYPLTGRFLNDTFDNSIGLNIFAGAGYQSFDFICEFSHYSSKKEMEAVSSFGNIPYNKTYKYELLALSVRYRLIQNSNIVPYAGAFAGVSSLDIYDDVYINKDNSINSCRYCFGPVAGILLFPNNVVNVFVEMKYCFNGNSFSDYNLSNRGIAGAWRKDESSKINLNALYVVGGLSCTIIY